MIWLWYFTYASISPLPTVHGFRIRRIAGSNSQSDIPYANSVITNIHLIFFRYNILFHQRIQIPMATKPVRKAFYQSR